MSEQICRYCKEPFDLKPGKPGYADECPACLHERTNPKTSPVREVAPEVMERARERAKIIDRMHRSLRRELAKIGPPRSDEQLDAQVTALIESVMTDL